MPYTATQLNAYYTSLTGTAPTGADAVLISASAAQSQNGTQSDTNTLLTVFNSAGVQATFEVAESTYQFFTGTGLSQSGLNFLEGNTGSGNANGLNTAYYTQFNTENRYYNFAINLASTGGAGNAGFVSSYGSLTFAQTVSAAYETIVGSSNVGTAAASAAIADIMSRQAYFTSVAQQRAGGVDAGGAAGQNIALKAIVVGYILEEANKADVGTYAKAIDQLEASVAAVGSGSQITSPFGTNILTNFSSGGQGFNTGFTALGVTGATQTNFSLTTGIDTFQPATGNIQFVGVVNQNGNTSQFNPSTLQGGDQVRGTGANNTLSVDTIGTVGDATGGATISGIQTINVRAIADPQTGNAAGATLNANFTPGATSINAFQARGAVTLTNVGGSTAVGIVNDGTTTGGSVNATYLPTVTTGTLNVSGGTTAGETATVAGSGLITVNVNSNGGLNTLSSLAFTGNAVTTLNLAATSALTITGGINDTGLTKLTASGSNPINIGTVNATALASLDTTQLTSTGALTATFTAAPTTTAIFALGAGADILTFGTAAAPISLTGVNINLGGGANALTVTGSLVGASVTGGTSTDVITVAGGASANGTTASSINSGGGGDTINIGTTVGGAANIAAGTALNGGGGATLVTNEFNLFNIGTAFTTAQRALITGFTNVAVDDALQSNSTYDINAIGAQNFATVGAAAGATADVIAVNTGAVVTFSGNIGGFGGGDLSTNTGAVTINEASVFAGATGNTITLGYQAQPAAVTSTVTLGTSGTNGVQTVNVVGSAATTNGTVVTLALTDAAATTVTFAGNDGFTFAPAATFTALTNINGAAATGNLTINASNLASTLNTPVTVTTGSGNDVVTVKDFDRVTTGGFTGTGFNTINVGITTSGQTYSSVLDAKATDHIMFTGQTSTNATKIVLNSTAVFQDYLDAASGTGIGVGAVSAFDFGGNTYLVENNNGAITFQNGVDSVIQLVGIHTVATTSTTAVILGS